MIIYRAATRDEREAAYCQVFNSHSAALVKGTVAAWALASEVAASGSDIVGKAVVLAGAASTRVAGVVRGLGIDNASDIPAQDFGIVQVSGFCDLVTTDGTITAGDLMITDANGAADQATVGTNGELAFGVALDADAATTLSAAMLKGNI